MNNASPTTSRWSDQQVELFHDRELPAELAERFEADLCSDSSLLARLDSVASLDRGVRRVLLTAPQERTAAGPRLGLLVRLGTLALAAAVILAVLWPMPGVDPPAGAIRERADAGGQAPAVSDPARSAGQSELLERAGVRVLASMNVPVKRLPEANPVRERPTRRPPEAPSPEALASPGPAPADLLASGDIDGFLAKLRQTPADQRDAAFDLLGGTLRSALTAEGVLDRLTPEEQLAVCSVWAREPRLRPVTFARLARLQANTELRDRVAEIVGQLSESRELLAWVRSYGLRSHPPGGHAG